MVDSDAFFFVEGTFYVADARMHSTTSAMAIYKQSLQAWLDARTAQEAERRLEEEKEVEVKLAAKAAKKAELVQIAQDEKASERIADGGDPALLKKQNATQKVKADKIRSSSKPRKTAALKLAASSVVTTTITTTTTTAGHTLKPPAIDAANEGLSIIIGPSPVNPKLTGRPLAYVFVYLPAL